MKSIKEYIKEDTNSDHLRSQIDLWLRQRGVMEFARKMISKIIPVKFTVKNNITYPTKLSIEITDHVPSYIQFDKRSVLKLLKNNQDQYIGSNGVIIEQSDIDKLGCITAIRNAKYVKDLNIDTYDSITFDNVGILKYPTINFYKKSDFVEFKLLNMDYREILSVKINSKAPIKLVLGTGLPLIDQLNNDPEVTEHIINVLRCSDVYDKNYNHIIFTNPDNIGNGEWVKA